MNKQKTDWVWEDDLDIKLENLSAYDDMWGNKKELKKNIKAFISNLLQQQREEIVSEIEGIKRLPNMAQNQNGIEYCSACGCPWDNIDNYCPDCATHNQALVDIIKILEKK